METTTRKQSFESAYTNLEQTVRNFSREKLSYEETINGFKGEIGVLKTSINNHNKEIQSVLEDNRRLQRQHEDDCTARCSIETLLTTVAGKQSVISQTLEQFQLIVQELDGRCEETIEFADSLKLRQTQLLDWIFECEVQEKNNREWMEGAEANIEQLNMKIAQQEVELTSANQAIQDQQCKINTLNADVYDSKMENEVQEKNFQKIMEGAEANIEQLNMKIAQMGVELTSANQAIQDQQQKINTLNADVNDAKMENEVQEKNFQKMMDGSEANIEQLNMKIAQMGVELTSANQAIQDQQCKINTLNADVNDAKMENEVQEKNFQKMMEGSEANIEQLNMKIAQMGVELTSANQAIQDQQCKINTLNADVNDAKMENEVQEKNYKKLMEGSEANIEQLNMKIAQMGVELTSANQAIQDQQQKLKALLDDVNDAKMENQVQEKNYKKLMEGSEANIEQLNMKIVQMGVELTSANNAVHNQQQKVKALLDDVNDAKMENQVQEKKYKKLLEGSEANIEQLNIKIAQMGVELTSANKAVHDQQQKIKNLITNLNDTIPPRTSPFRISASMGSLRATPSGILKGSRSSTIATKNVSWSDGIREQPRKTKPFEPLTFSSSSDEEESDLKDDPAYELPIKRARLSEKENKRVPVPAITPTTPMKPAMAKGKTAVTTNTHYKFFKNRSESRESSPKMSR